jgi:hypothetical protein
VERSNHRHRVGIRFNVRARCFNERVKVIRHLDPKRRKVRLNVFVVRIAHGPDSPVGLCGVDAVRRRNRIEQSGIQKRVVACVRDRFVPVDSNGLRGQVWWIGHCLGHLLASAPVNA